MKVTEMNKKDAIIIAVMEQQFKELKDDVKEIVKQTRATNGKVAEHSAQIEQWKGGLVIAVLILLPFVFWMVTTINDIPEMIQKALAVHKLPE